MEHLIDLHSDVNLLSAGAGEGCKYGEKDG